MKGVVRRTMLLLQYRPSTPSDGWDSSGSSRDHGMPMPWRALRNVEDLAFSPRKGLEKPNSAGENTREIILCTSCSTAPEINGMVVSHGSISPRSA